MTLQEAVEQLVLGDCRRLHVLTIHDLRRAFPDDTARAFRRGLASLRRVGLLQRVARGVYLNMAAPATAEATNGRLTEALRPGHVNYLSYESALASAGSLGQQPFWSTMATTGNSGEYRTPYGPILFRHTTRDVAEIIANTVRDEALGELIAHPALALSDLRRTVPALVSSVDMHEHAEICNEWGPCDVR